MSERDCQDDRMYVALTHLASLDTRDENLRDHPKAYDILDTLVMHAYAEGRKDERETPRETLDDCGAGDTIAYKFQAPNGSYWYIRADDHKTIAYWRDKRKLIPLTADRARIAAETGAVSEVSGGGA